MIRRLLLAAAPALMLLAAVAAPGAGADTFLGGGSIALPHPERGLVREDVTTIVRLRDDGRSARTRFRFVLRCRPGGLGLSWTDVTLRLRDGQVRGRTSWRNDSGFRLTLRVRGQAGAGTMGGTFRATGRKGAQRCSTGPRTWQARAQDAPAAADPAATRLYGVVRGLGGVVVGVSGGRVRVLADVAGECRGRPIGGMNLSPWMRVGGDGRFSVRERLRTTNDAGTPERWRIRLKGRLEGGGIASGTIRARVVSGTGGRRVACDTTRRWRAVG